MKDILTEDSCFKVKAVEFKRTTVNGVLALVGLIEETTTVMF
jgi:hypothetical protein